MNNTEWYTQRKYVEAARQVMSSIELDPASCVAANKIVKAERIYTREENGLAQEWSAKTLWLNPPYSKVKGRSLCGMFIEKLVRAYEHGHVEQAILLTMDDSSTRWFQLLRDYPICFANHKVHFYTTSPTKANPTACHRHGTIFVYLGPDEQRFIEQFSKFGDIWRRVNLNTPVTPLELSFQESER